MSEAEIQRAANDAKKEVNKTGDEVKEQAADVQKEAENFAQVAVEKAHQAVDAIKEASSHAAETLHTRAGELSVEAREEIAKAKKELGKASEEAFDASKNYSEHIVDELKDPAVSTTVLFTAVTATAASTYLTQQQKQGKLTPLLAAGVAVGVVALSFAEYFSVKAYFRRKDNSTTSS